MLRDGNTTALSWCNPCHWIQFAIKIKDSEHASLLWKICSILRATQSWSHLSAHVLNPKIKPVFKPKILILDPTSDLAGGHWAGWEFGSSNNPFPARGALCIQMDFTRTFEANTKCNNMKYVWSHFYQILVVLKYHRCLWNNIFDTDIFRCINTHIKGVYLAFFGIYMLLEMSVSNILFPRHLWYFRTTKIW